MQGLRGHEHNRQRSLCKDCGGANICQHNRQRNTCNLKDCGGTSICQHNRRRSVCKDCEGTGICQHNLHVSFVQGLICGLAIDHIPGP